MIIENTKDNIKLKKVIATSAVEDMYLSQDFVNESLKVSSGEKTSEQLRQEVIDKYTERERAGKDMFIENNKEIVNPNKSIAAGTPQKKLKGECFLEEYYGKPLEDINGWECENVSTGTQVGKEEW